MNKKSNFKRVSKKRATALIVAIITAIALLVPSMAFAASGLSIKKIEVERTHIEVDFNRDVQWQTGSYATIKDSSGKSFTATLYNRDDDDCDVKISSLPAGKSYTLKIYGVSDYSGVSATPSHTFYIPKSPTKVWIEEVDCEGRWLDIDFSQNIQWKSGYKATIKDSSGKSYSAKIYDRDNDSCDMKTSGLKSGKYYTLTVSGIAVGGKSTSASIKFKAGYEIKTYQNSTGKTWSVYDD